LRKIMVSILRPFPYRKNIEKMYWENQPVCPFSPYSRLQIMWIAKFWCVQALHQLRHEGTGGETLLVDGFRAADILREQDPASFDLLCTTRLEHDFVDQIRHLYYRSYDTVIRIDPDSRNLEWIRYNLYDRSPAPVTGPMYKALASLHSLLEDASAVLKFKLRPGRIFLFDNWRVLHGRTAFTGRREMGGCYLPRDDWLNKARQLALI